MCVTSIVSFLDFVNELNESIASFYNQDIAKYYRRVRWFQKCIVAVVAVHAADDEPIATGRHDRSWGDEGG